MIVFLRAAGVKSELSKPAPVYNDNLLELSRFCLESFVEAFKEVDPRVVFILDKATIDYDEMINEVVPFDKKIRHTDLGIDGTCRLQYDLYDTEADSKVLFQEIDYYYLPGTGKEIVEAVDELQFITPYDHPDKYDTETSPEVKVVNGRHWKKTISTTSTFATKRENFLKHRDLFYKHGWIDHDRWVEISEEGGELWSPLPAIATHMVEEYLSPHVDWKFENVNEKEAK